MLGFQRAYGSLDGPGVTIDGVDIPLFSIFLDINFLWKAY